MFRRILVPVDFTARRLAPSGRGAGRRREPGGSRRVCHVIERLIDDGFRAIESFYRKLEAAAREAMNRLLIPLAGKGLSVRAEILYGKPVGEILRFAQANRGDLIVIELAQAPLRRSAESWGTISYKVGILSRCPVLLVK